MTPEEARGEFDELFGVVDPDDLLERVLQAANLTSGSDEERFWRDRFDPAGDDAKMEVFASDVAKAYPVSAEEINSAIWEPYELHLSADAWPEYEEEGWEVGSRPTGP